MKKVSYLNVNITGGFWKKKLDMIAANSLKVEGAGFGVDTNVITLITKDDMIKLPLMSKADVASEILNHILKNRSKEN